MLDVNVGGYALKVDPDATRASYERGVHGPASCGCWYCRNWIAGREHLVPVEVRRLLDQLEIPFDGEIEVWHVPGEASRMHTAVGTCSARHPRESTNFRLVRGISGFGQGRPIRWGRSGGRR